MRLGLYAPARPPADLAGLRSIGFEELVLSYPAGSSPITLRGADLEEVRAAGLAVGVMFWPLGDRLDHSIINALHRARPDVVVLDCEGQWRTSEHEEMGARWVAALRVALPSARVEITTHAAHSLSRSRGRFTSAVDLVEVQTHSIRNRLGTVVEWGSHLAPGVYQREVYSEGSRWRAATELERLGACLPLWSQVWPGHTRAEALEEALAAVESAGVERVRYWQEKHLRKPATRSALSAVVGRRVLRRG